MKVCYFGTYDSDYVRNRVLIDGLRSAGAQVLECHAQIWRDTEDKVRQARKGLLNCRLAARLARTYTSLISRYLRTEEHDVIVVGHLGHLDMLPALLVARMRGRPLVFDAMLPLYETVVVDRGLAGRGSATGRAVRILERAACSFADLILTDTHANAAYYADHYGVPRNKLARLWIGAEDVYTPLARSGNGSRFTVLYVGKFSPLHGLEHVLQAAGLLKNEVDIDIEFIGSGQSSDQMRQLASDLGLVNIRWGPSWLCAQELQDRVAAADVCLGIFGASEKANRVIPAKVYMALAMQKPVITRDSQAAQEILMHRENAILCPAAEPQAIAAAILELKGNDILRERISRQGYELFKSRCSSAVLGREMLTFLETLTMGSNRHQRG